MTNESLKASLQSLLKKMEIAIDRKRSAIQGLHPSQKISATNLVQYLVLRSEDVRSLQDELHISGLSSLASSESHILRQLQSILERLGQQFSQDDLSACDYFTGRSLISSRADRLFGLKQDLSIPFLMITFDSEFADNYQLIKKLLESGMNIARINSAHGNKEIWQNMIELVHQASERTGLPCKIYMDLPGPRMRTSLLGKGRLAGKVTIIEGQQIMMAETDADYDPSDIVIGCDEPGIIKQLHEGSKVLFDNGIVEAEVLTNNLGIAVLKIVRISGSKSQLKSKKGINFPGATFTLSPLTQQDMDVLPFVCEQADLIGYSFIRQAADLERLQKELSGYKKRPAIIVKVETSESVRNFPALLMQGMMEEVFGVMIARGDLAVEIGFERLSEIQEEILWISEAAHVPVIWATQVLETLNKSGIATRSEITDASYAAQAECVMLNKGDYIIHVIRTLNDILHRSGEHHVKKRFTFRPMKIASDYLGN